MVTFLRPFFLAYSNAYFATLSEFSWVTIFMLSTTPFTLWNHHKTVKSCPCNKTTQYLHYISFMNNGNFLTVVLHCIFKCKSSNPFRIRSSNHFHGLYYSSSTLKTLYLPESHYYDNRSTFGNFSQTFLSSHNLNHQQNNYIT